MGHSLPPFERPEVVNINTIPDEMLAKVLVFVPFSTSLIPVGDLMIQQHHALSLVSRRFNTVMLDPAFPFQVLECQYNDEVQLYGIEKAAKIGELCDTAAHAAKIDALVDRMLENTENGTVRPALRMSLLVLDYLTGKNTSPNIRSRIMFFEWAFLMFEHESLVLLRWTLAILHGTLYLALNYLETHNPHDNDDVPGNNLQPVTRGVSPEVGGAQDMALRRAFETAVLLYPDSRSLAVVTEADLEVIRRPYFAEAAFLPSTFNCAWRQLELGFNNMAEDDWRYVSSYQWRLLSDSRTSLHEQAHSMTDYCGFIVREFEDEIARDKEGFIGASFLCETEDIDGLRTIMNLKELSKLLRSAAARIERGGKAKIPVKAVKFATETPLPRCFPEEDQA